MGILFSKPKHACILCKLKMDGKFMECGRCTATYHINCVQRIYANIGKCPMCDATETLFVTKIDNINTTLLEHTTEK